MDVCAKLRGVFHERRVGHAGTLDPMATGVLPVFLGRATRAVDYVARGDKEYIVGLRLGLVTDTQDITGRVLEEHPAEVPADQLEAVLSRFLGPLEQVPPMYSAVKVNGKKLYQMARQGMEVERRARPIVIHEIQLLDGGPEEYRLRVRCSKGTYVRTLCHDIGAALGCGGTMVSLRRTMAAGYTLEDAVALDTLLKMEHPESRLLAVDTCFQEFPPAVISGRNLKLARNGNPFPWTEGEGYWRVYDSEGTFLLLGLCHDGRMVTEKSFFEVS